MSRIYILSVACVFSIAVYGCSKKHTCPTFDNTSSKPEKTMLRNFESGPVGGIPNDWHLGQTKPSTAMATWAIVPDYTAPSGKHVFCLTNTKNENQTFNLAIADTPKVKDFELSVKVKARTGKMDQGGGPIWRCKDENNYYVCRINPLENNYRIYQVKDGDRKQLQSVDVETVAGEWYILKVTCHGNQMSCYLNDKEMLSIEDSTFTEAGAIGLWTKADAVTSFDDFAVTFR